jgi:hypothetical protein
LFDCVASSRGFASCTKLVIAEDYLFNYSKEEEKGHPQHAERTNSSEENEDCEEMEVVEDFDEIWRGSVSEHKASE